MTDKYSARKTELRYKGKVVYEVTIQQQKNTTSVDLCEKYKNDSGEECYRKIYY
jgi:hypothetical protein